MKKDQKLQHENITQNKSRNFSIEKEKINWNERKKKETEIELKHELHEIPKKEEKITKNVNIKKGPFLKKEHQQNQTFFEETKDEEKIKKTLQHEYEKDVNFKVTNMTENENDSPGNNSENLIEMISPIKHQYKKKNINKKLRAEVWSKNMGKKYSGKCFCCKTAIIDVWNFECGHIIAESKGGKTDLTNLIPICSVCNKSMGNKEMNEYIKDCGFPLEIKNYKKEGLFKLTKIELLDICKQHGIFILDKSSKEDIIKKINLSFKDNIPNIELNEIPKEYISQEITFVEIKKNPDYILTKGENSQTDHPDNERPDLFLKTNSPPLKKNNHIHKTYCVVM